MKRVLKRQKGHNYERVCIGCRKLRHKRYLLRTVALQDGCVIFDETQKLGGRGAYICPLNDCIIAMVKKQSLTNSLKRQVDGSKIGELLSQLKRHILWMSGDLTRIW